MSKILKILLGLSFYITSSNAQNAISKHKKLSLAVCTFYKQEDFRWSIAGNLQGQNPNIYSELIWSNLKGPGIGFEINIKPWKQLQLITSYSQNSISSGTVNDTDYQQDNRQVPSYQAFFKSNKGKTSFLEIGLGYKLLTHKKIQLTPYGGIAYDKQSLYILKNETATNAKELNSTYQTRWAGPYIGLDIETALFNYSKIKLDVNYYQIDYSAKADWNMIDAFAHPISFKHQAKGYLLRSQILADNPIDKTFSIFVKGNIFYSVTAAGTDHLYLSDGDNLYTRLNEVIRKGTEIGVGLHLNF